jgi:branched-chain amino acid transport system permease protein
VDYFPPLKVGVKNMAKRKMYLLVLCLTALLFLPVMAEAIDETYLISSMTRVLIFAIAAISLDFIVGYGALVSFGHSAFVGLGAYTAAIFILIVAMLVASLVAGLTGLISLRTHGIHFIMITLAFAQMLYFLFISLGYYGGEDGLIMQGRNELPLIDTSDDTSFYYLCLTFLVLFIVLARRLVNSHFGRVLQGSKHNEQRMKALGFNTYWYRLIAYVIAAMGAAVAGVLLANKTEYVDPGLFSWHLSGELLVMIILGGLGSIYGAVIGAFTYLMLEQVFSAYTEHWMVLLGPVLILVIIYARQGVYGVLKKWWATHA